MNNDLKHGASSTGQSNAPTKNEPKQNEPESLHWFVDCALPAAMLVVATSMLLGVMYNFSTLITADSLPRLTRDGVILIACFAVALVFRKGISSAIERLANRITSARYKDTDLKFADLKPEDGIPINTAFKGIRIETGEISVTFGASDGGYQNGEKDFDPPFPETPIVLIGESLPNAWVYAKIDRKNKNGFVWAATIIGGMRTHHTRLQWVAIGKDPEKAEQKT